MHSKVVYRSFRALAVPERSTRKREVEPNPPFERSGSGTALLPYGRRSTRDAQVVASLAVWALPVKVRPLRDPVNTTRLGRVNPAGRRGNQTPCALRDGASRIAVAVAEDDQNVTEIRV